MESVHIKLLLLILIDCLQLLLDYPSQLNQKSKMKFKHLLRNHFLDLMAIELYDETYSHNQNID